MVKDVPDPEAIYRELEAKFGITFGRGPLIAEMR
jgi:hypothetical protein